MPKAHINNANEKGDSLRSVFVCGFIDKRWHNSSLEAIVSDLLASHYVSCNAGNAAQWSSLLTQRMVAHAHVFIFFVNEFTLADIRCLLTLQYAWHHAVPVFMLRPPRTKLIVCESDAGYRTPLIDTSRSSKDETESDSSLLDLQPDYHLLQYILNKGYRMSIVYDRLNHQSSMHKIKSRLEKVLEPVSQYLDASRSLCPSRTCSDDGDRVNSSADFALPSIRSTRSQLITNRTNYRTNACDRLRSCRSMNNISSALSNERTRKDASVGRRGNHNESRQRHRTKNKALSQSQRSTEDTRHLSRYNSEESDASYTYSQRRSSLSDASNFHTTQYLVFPIKDQTQKPVLVQFPDDVLRNEKIPLNDTWGSDTSLEEDAQMASKIEGDLVQTNDDEMDGVIPADADHAPYNDPL